MLWVRRPCASFRCSAEPSWPGSTGSIWVWASLRLPSKPGPKVLVIGDARQAELKQPSLLQPTSPFQADYIPSAMSFDHSSALESQPTTWRRQDDPAYADDPEFNTFTQKLSDRLFGASSLVTQLSRQVALLGTKRETERVRERVRDLIDEAQNEFKEIGEGLKRVATWEDMGPGQKFTQGKLNREFRAALTEFQVLQRTAIDKQRASATAARAALEDDGPSSPSGQQTQQGGPGTEQEQEQLRLADQSEVDFQESLIIERETEIRQIEQSVSELNELFRDVAHMVHEQGGQLDLISENVAQTRDDTRGASRELTTASRHQRNARNKACCLLIILAIVLTVVILAVVLG